MAGLMTRAEPAGSNDPLPAAPTRDHREIRPPSLDTLFTVLFAAAGWSLGLRELGDNSFLWHWRTGRLILQHGIPHADPYSFTVPGARWIAQSWLAELAYGIADRLAGGIGVRLLVAVVGATIVASSFRLALRLTGHRIRAAGLTFGALATVLTIWSERPLVFGLAGVLALVWAVEVPESRLGRNPLIAIPAVMWFWGNVHGSFSLGYVYLGLHLLGRFFDGAPPNAGRERKLLTGSVISVGALLVNPYGFGLLWFPVDLMRRGSVLAGVSEWQSPSFRELGGVLFAGWLTVAVLALVHKHPSRRDLVITLVFAFLGLWAVRNVGVTALVTLPIAARAFAGGHIRGADRQRLGWAFSAAFAAFFVLQTTSAAAGHDFNLDRYPVKAMVEMQDRRLLGRRLYTTDAWAGYTIARYWPEQHVFMDDRYDMYPKRVVDDYDTIADVKPAWRDTLDKWRIDVVVWPTKRPLSQALALDVRWKRIYADKKAVIFVRTPEV